MRGLRFSGAGACAVIGILLLEIAPWPTEAQTAPAPPPAAMIQAPIEPNSDYVHAEQIEFLKSTIEAQRKYIRLLEKRVHELEAVKVPASPGARSPQP